MNSQNKNLLTAVALSLLILLGFHQFYEVPRQHKLQQMAAEEQAKTGDAQIAGGNGDTPAGQLSVLPEAIAVKDRAETVAGSDRIKIANAQLYGSLARSGIRFDDLTLATYFTSLDHQEHVDLLSPKGTEAPYYAEFGWVAANADTSVPNDKTVWKSEGDASDLTPDHPVKQSWDNGHGLIFHRVIALDANYMFTVTQSVDNKGGAAVTLYPYASVTRLGTPNAAPANQDATGKASYKILDSSPLDGEIGVLNGKLTNAPYGKLKANSLKSDELQQSSLGGWVGFTDKYWLVAVIPDQAETIAAQFRHEPAGATDLYQANYKAGAKSIAPGQSVSTVSHMFAGAKKVDLLAGYRDSLGIPNFHLAVDWGFFSFLTRPFFYGIDHLAKLFGNFGLGILAFTVVVRILIFPLAWKTFREMNRMTDLSPQLATIKEKHGANNKQAMQAEILELYQREKVNPVSGCLPMILQIPIFLSLFKVLSTTIEMRQQPFYGYVHDLSAQDPTNVFTLFGLVPDWHVHLAWMTLPPHLGFLPLILGCTLMALQLNGPKMADPLQQKMMLINPIVFTFFMAHLPVGLVIYYIWSNTISIGQQRFIRWFYRKRYKKEPASPVLKLPDTSPK